LDFEGLEIHTGERRDFRSQGLEGTRIGVSL
jgi:hypothetical protein